MEALEVRHSLPIRMSIRLLSRVLHSPVVKSWRQQRKATLKRYSHCMLSYMVWWRSSRFFQVSLELGGKSPHIIFESADLEQGINKSHLLDDTENHSVIDCLTISRELGRTWYPLQHRSGLHSRIASLCTREHLWQVHGFADSKGQVVEGHTRVWWGCGRRSGGMSITLLISSNNPSLRSLLTAFAGV